VTRQREGVDEQGPAQDLHLLTGMAHAVDTPEEQGVVQGAVERFRVVSPCVQMWEVRVRCRDGPNVLRAVEPATLVLVVAVEPDGERAPAVGLGKNIVLVPRV
jgi:hypothetical protein